MKLEPSSDCTDLGKPKLVKNLVKALTTVLDFMLRRGIASGKQVDAHIIFNNYWLPALVLGKGPTQSIMTLVNGSSKAGIGFKAERGIV